MRTDIKADVAKRLARIEGQVRGLSQMVADHRCCLEVVAQVRAARAALAKVEQAAPADHLGSCVEAAIVSGDPVRQREKMAAKEPRAAGAGRGSAPYALPSALDATYVGATSFMLFTRVKLR